MKQPTEERIQKFLSRAGVCSRRRAEVLIAHGRVSVNGKVLSQPGAKVRPRDSVVVDGKRVFADTEGIYIALFKPSGVITSLEDPEGRAVVTDLLPNSLGRVWPVGRLDWESEGLILMTNDGDLTNLLTHPSGGVQKTYNVKLRGMLRSKDPGLEKMRRGVTLDDGFETSTAEVSIDSSTGKHTWVQVVLHQGHNRQIRKMAEAVGHTVLRLRRVEIGPLQLSGLRPGKWRTLYRDEVLALFEAGGTKPSALARQYHPDIPEVGGEESHRVGKRSATARHTDKKPAKTGSSGKRDSKRSDGRARPSDGRTGGRGGAKKHKSADKSRRSVRTKK